MVCEGVYGQGKEDGLDKGFNRVDVGEVNEQRNVLPCSTAHDSLFIEAAHFDKSTPSNRRLRVHVIGHRSWLTGVPRNRQKLDIRSLYIVEVATAR